MDTPTSPISFDASKPVATENAVPSKAPTRLRRWVARVGVAGFLFFLIKGLLWLIVPALVIAFR